MKNITIEWKHFDQNGKTCNRCSLTGENLKKVISDIETANKNIQIKLVETKLDEKDMGISNSILINGVSIEDLILGSEVSANHCESCSCMTEKQESCRTLKVGDIDYEEIPYEVLKESLQLSLNKKF
jgi:hypothetical protein